MPYNAMPSPMMPKTMPTQQSIVSIRSMAPALLEVVAATPPALELSCSPGLAAPVMLASKPVLGRVTVAGASVMVAVTAVPLELTVMMV